MRKASLGGRSGGRSRRIGAPTFGASCRKGVGAAYLARCACLDLLRWGVAVSPDPASTSPPGGSSSTRAVSFLRPCRSSRAPRLHGATVPREGGRSSAAPKGYRRPSAVSWPRALSMEVYLELPPLWKATDRSELTVTYFLDKSFRLSGGPTQLT